MILHDSPLTTRIRRRMRRQQVIDISWVSGILMIAAVATIMMPVSYRAGADRAHPHSIVQGMIDELRGTPHHHDHDAPPVQAQMSSLFTFAIPLSVSAIGLIDAGQPTSLHRMPFEPMAPRAPDLPIVDSIALGSDIAGAFAFVAGIAALVLLVLSVDRRLWAVPRRLDGIVMPLLPPPPRPAR